MAAFPLKLGKTLQRNFERIDNTVCVAILLAAGAPAIVVMFLLSLPLLPFFGVCLCIGGATRLRFEPSVKETETGDETHDDRSHPTSPTPHYA